MNRILTTAAALALTVSALAQGSPQTSAAMLREAKSNSQASAIHRDLTENVGARVTGSYALNRAIDWAIAKFNSFGISNARKEQWGETPTGFDRGARMSFKIVEPFERTLTFSTNNWTVGTTGPVRGHVAMMPTTELELNANKSKYRGAYILMPQVMGMGGARMRTFSDLDKMMDEAGIAGRVFHSGTDLVWTSGNWRDYTDETRPKTPMIVVTKDDYNVLRFNMRQSPSFRIEADIENIFHDKPMTQYNVIAEIKGTEKPDEIIIVCGHLDSWNGPGSQGASDNGTGTSATLEAARLLMKAGAKPKRTIRFILWTGEEQGLLGSTAYVSALGDDINKISAVLNEDSGQNWQAAIAGLPEMMPMLNEAAAPLINAWPTMPFAPREVQRFPRAGSDHVPFVARGVPGFFMVKGGNLSYRRIWHTQHDRWTEVPPENLMQMSGNMAVLAYNLACADEMMPRLDLGRTSARLEMVGGWFEGFCSDDGHGHGGEYVHPHANCGLHMEFLFKLSRGILP
jgi:hypothetical protein